jgi:hypothetical protein
MIRINRRRRLWRAASRIRRPVGTVAAATVVFLLTAAPAAFAKTPAPSPAPAPAPADPIEVRPAWNDVPGQAKIVTLLGTASEIGLACCIAAIVIGGALLGLGRLSGSMQSGRGSGMALAGGGGALLIVLAPRLVSWMIG